MNPQEAPRYYGYHVYKSGGYASTTRCASCGNVGLYEDCHPIHPCKHCGGHVDHSGAAKWVPPVRHKLLFWRVVTPGYWQPKGAT